MSTSENQYAVKVTSLQADLWKKIKPKIGQLDIELTERCNNDCIHCYINQPVLAELPELGTDDVKSLLNQAVELGCLRVRFTGGEPLLRPDFEELYVYARKLGLKVIIFTNATLINENTVELLKKIPPKEPVEVTVYGMHQKSYEAVSRKPNTFKAAWQGIQLLIDHDISFIVKQALLPQNKDEIDEFEAWASTLAGMWKAPSYSMNFDLRARRDFEEKNEMIRSLRISPKEGLRILLRNKEFFLNEMKQFCARFMRPPGDTLFACGAGKGGATIDAYGNIQLCMLLRHPDTIYPLSNGSLSDAVTRHFPKIRSLKAKNPDYLRRCARCFLKGLCEQCPGKSWMEHGTLDTPVEYLCQVAHAKARYFGMVEENENAWEVDNWQERVERFTRKEVPVQ